MISHRYARANNPQVAGYEESKPTTWIKGLDANNLYGWAMSHPLPIAQFEWVAQDEFEKIDWLGQTDDQDRGYIVSVDLQYPKELHDLHNDYPLAPERMRVKEEWLSDTAINIRAQYSFNRGDGSSKLIPNLLDKKEYVLHYRTLKFYLEHGLKLIKVHKAIRFFQSPWLKGYIELNQNLRAKATSAFEMDFFKLMNNAVFGKTCENQKRRTNIGLILDAQQLLSYVAKPNFMAFKIFDENLVAIEKQKTQVQINRPFYAGFTVLELAKLHMYRFHYDYIKRKYPDAKLLFTDTDSLYYHLATKDLEEELFKDKEQFDYSDYEKTGKYFDPTNRNVIGKFKCETNGNPIVEFVGLRPKMYSYLYQEKADPSSVIKEKHRVKGISAAASRSLKHFDYKDQLEHPHENYLTNKRLGSKLH